MMKIILLIGMNVLTRPLNLSGKRLSPLFANIFIGLRIISYVYILYIHKMYKSNLYSYIAINSERYHCNLTRSACFAKMPQSRRKWRFRPGDEGLRVAAAITSGSVRISPSKGLLRSKCNRLVSCRRIGAFTSQ